jgi:hypothetical protein
MAHRQHFLFARAVLLAFATAVCAGLTMGVGLVVLDLTEAPPRDGERWLSVRTLVEAAPACLLFAALAYPCMLGGLLRTNLAKSLPVVFVVSLASMALTARGYHLGALVSLICSCAAMDHCKTRFGDATAPAR